MTVSLRPAREDDVAFLVTLVGHPEVAPFLSAVRATDATAIRGELGRMQSEPDAFGIVVIEQDDKPTGTACWERVNRRSRIASVGGLAVEPSARGAGVATQAMALLLAELFDQRGFHRVQVEVYGFNDRAAAFFERVGFEREGVRRRAYWRNGVWVDGVLFGLVAEDRG